MKNRISKLPRSAFGGRNHEKGIHHPNGLSKDTGRSMAGIQNESGSKFESKLLHEQVLREMKEMPKPKLMAKGGCVGASCPGCSSCYSKGGDVDENDGSMDPEYYQKGVHRTFTQPGQSEMGSAVRGHWSHGSKERNQVKSKQEHHKVLSEMQRMKKPNLYAQGGYIANPSEAQAREGYPVHKDEGGEIDSDDSIMDSVAEELIQAFESKNKSQILDAIRAIVLSCKE